MASVYDRADIYDLLEDESRYETYKNIGRLYCRTNQ